MYSPKKPKSLRDIIKERQQSGFVGREDQIKHFRENLTLPVESRMFLFNIWGQGGVGKSTLLKQFRKIAEDAKTITAYIDEAEKTVPDVLGRLAEDLENKGYKLPQFSERYKVYRQKRQELETDPDAPQGFSAFVGKTFAKTGLRLARQIPVGGAMVGLVDEDALANQAGEWSSYIAKKLTNKDEVLLVNEPVEILTPLFLEDIVKITEKVDIALFLDTYERTGEFLDSWLRDTLEGRYGEIPPKLLFIIAGRNELDQNLWAGYEGVLARFPLEAFTEEEAKQYLTRKGITNNAVVEVILSLSGRLPLLVAMLADAHPTDPKQINEPSNSAVERFLKWVDDPKRRQVALDAALSRFLNRDIVAALRGEEAADELFNWLKETSFVNERTDGWVYHDIVRTQMLRHKRLTSPQGWADLHGKLAGYYGSLRDGLELAEENKYTDPIWQNYALNCLYHRLCQSPQKSLNLALNEFLAGLKKKRNFAESFAEIMVQAGKDADFREVKDWGEQLVNGLKAYEEKNYEVAAEMFTKLLSNNNLDVKGQAVALGQRGYIYNQSSQYSKALADLSEAIKLSSEESEYFANRGWTYCLMERYPEALQDFNLAIEFDPKSTRAIANRGEAYLSMKQYPEALQDLNLAIELDPKLAWAIASRGETYYLMERYPEALKDFNLAIELDPKLAWAIASRGD
ncbi:tetratricopeptide repeat protein, partial [Cronbergia sp. UHCC 0137]|uniref:tetratricopeptide repeat protein n=1 Tax=Cronbergia sp. UHCC 0137 TaxID=3110239 RepID=UPI002B1F6DD9